MVGCFHDFNTLFVGLSAHILDVLVGLVLRIDHQWPSPALINNDSIFNGVIVFGQSRHIPLLDGHWLSQEINQIGIRLEIDFEFLHPGHPYLHQPLTILAGEGPSIGNHTRRQYRITGYIHLLRHQPLDLNGPPLLLIAQP